MNRTALEVEKREGRNRPETENGGKGEKEECVEGWESIPCTRLRGGGVREEALGAKGC